MNNYVHTTRQSNPRIDQQDGATLQTILLSKTKYDDAGGLYSYFNRSTNFWIVTPTL